MTACAVKRIAVALSLFTVVTLYAERIYGETPAGVTVRVARVIDGDTIELSDGRYVRYAGIDTPEVRRRRGGKWEYAPEIYSVEATDRNRVLVGGREVSLEFDTRVSDKYGRLLAYVYAGDVMVNAALLEDGYAIMYTFPPNVKHFHEFLGAQKKAQREGRGLWGSVKTLPAGEAGSHADGIVAVEGVVSGVKTAGDKVFINIGKGRGKELSAVIFASNLPFFREEEIDPFADLDGRRVKITGKIRQWGEPVMVLDNPSQLEIL